VRFTLLLIAAGLIAVFGLAIWLKPDARGMGTHRQLGLPPCTFLLVTRLPCPSCGMTTSFSHLVRGQVVESLQANPIGTLLAAFCMVMVPYCVVCGLWGRRLFIRDYEVFLSRVITVFLVLLFAGWGIRLGARWLHTGTVLIPPQAPPGEVLRRRGDASETRMVVAPGVDPVPGALERLPDLRPLLRRGHDDGV
jgi:hypothetical protein